LIGRRGAMLLSLLVLSSSALGCGGKGGGPTTPDSVAQQPVSAPPASTTAAPKATTPTATATAPTSTAPASTTTAPTATTGVPTGGETQPGGAGDEQPARTPAAFTVDGATITPATITVAAFLAIDVAVTARHTAQRVELQAPGGGVIDVGAGGTAHRVLGGLKPGDYALTTAAGGRATLHVVSGGAPGP
jgi:hypothetical protein